MDFVKNVDYNPGQKRLKITRFEERRNNGQTKKTTLLYPELYLYNFLVLILDSV